MRLLQHFSNTSPTLLQHFSNTLPAAPRRCPWGCPTCANVWCARFDSTRRLCRPRSNGVCWPSCQPPTPRRHWHGGWTGTRSNAARGCGRNWPRWTNRGRTAIGRSVGRGVVSIAGRPSKTAFLRRPSTAAVLYMLTVRLPGSFSPLSLFPRFRDASLPPSSLPPSFRPCPACATCATRLCTPPRPRHGHPVFLPRQTGCHWRTRPLTTATTTGRTTGPRKRLGCGRPSLPSRCSRTRSRQSNGTSNAVPTIGGGGAGGRGLLVHAGRTVVCGGGAASQMGVPSGKEFNQFMGPFIYRSLEVSKWGNSVGR